MYFLLKKKALEETFEMRSCCRTLSFPLLKEYPNIKQATVQRNKVWPPPIKVNEIHLWSAVASFQEKDIE